MYILDVVLWFYNIINVQILFIIYFLFISTFSVFLK
jgi:hypothetical protein